MASREVQSILDFIKAAGIPYRVTGILGRYISSANPCDPHSRTSMHCAEGTNGKGLAVDLGGTLSGVTSQSVAEMCAIRRAFEPVAPKLAELFFNGPGITKIVKNGQWRDGLTFLGPTQWAAHRNHVHVSVPRGTFLTPAPSRPPVTLEVRPMWDPPLQVVDFLPYWAGSGGYMLFADGGVGGIGDAPHREGKQPFGNDYWIGRTPARLERLGPAGYTVIATSGERYDYP